MQSFQSCYFWRGFRKQKASLKLKSLYAFRHEEKLIFGVTVRVLFANPLISQTHFKTSIYEVCHGKDVPGVVFAVP